MEEGDGAGEGAADEEAEHEGEEELLHFLVRLRLEGLGPGLCGLTKHKRTKIEKLVIVFPPEKHDATQATVMADYLSIPRQRAHSWSLTASFSHRTSHYQAQTLIQLVWLEGSPKYVGKCDVRIPIM